MKRILSALLLAAVVCLSAAPSHAGVIDTAKASGTAFLQQVHGQVGFGTLGLRATPRENACGYYFARFEAPFLIQNVYIAVEPRRAAGADADHDIQWSGSVAYRIF